MCVLITAGLAVVAQLTGGSAAAPVDPGPVLNGSASGPLAEARRLGRRVEVPAEHRETQTVYANPDGTFTAEIFLEPVRVRRGAVWVPVDTTLTRDTGGSVRPVATAVPVVFSGGGSQPLVRIGHPGRQVALRWHTTLPRPMLSGDTATYAEVLPGVDLRMRAKPQGYSKVLVVKSRVAANNPALRRLTFGLRADGVSVRSDRHGNVAMYDARGAVAFGTGAPIMWDSSRPEARRAVGDVRLGGSTMTLIPNRGLLTDPAVRFPLYIDPDTGAPRTGFAQVFSGYPDDPYWGGDGEGVAKVGRCWEGDGRCNGIGVGRAYFVFDVRGVIGKHIISAEFNAFLAYTPTCVAKRVQGWATNPVGPGTTWNNQPGNAPGTGAVDLGWHEAAGGRADCPPRHLGWGAKAAVENGVRFSGGFATIMLKAENESDQDAWKKFLVDNQTPYMSVGYNSFPDKPFHMSAESKGCGLEPNEPYVHPPLDGDPNHGPRGPRLWARVTDPDGGLVHTQFEWYTRGGARLGVTATAPARSGTYYSIDVPSAHAPDGAKLAFRARGADGTDFGGWSDWCHVTIDRTAPRNAPAVSSASYPECTDPETCPVSGSAGRAGAFVFGSGGDPDVIGFRYRLQGLPPGFVATGSGGTATVLVTPPAMGANQLFVEGVDRAGNISPQRSYIFNVGRGTPPRGHWRLDGMTGTQVVDDSPNGHDGSFATGTAGWRSGRHGDALWLNGATGHVATTGGRTVRTDQSFAVAAWVKLDRLDTAVRTAVSQDGGQVSGFALRYNPATKRWNFTMPSDSGGAQNRVAESSTQAVAGRWTHLVGTSDVATRQLQVFTDGVPGTAAAHNTPWDATGTVQLGRGRSAGTPADYWPGSLDDVRIYDRKLSTEEIAELAGTPTTEHLFLPFDEETGAATIDASGNHRVGFLSGSASRTTGRVGSGAVRFDGGTDTVALDGPAIRTDGSFTVSAWVRLSAADANWRTVLSQDGGDESGFRLWYRGDTRKWAFTLRQPSSDSVSVDSTQEASVGAWTHLAGVYDAASRRIRLYVDTAPMGDVAVTGGWHSTGAFQVGRSLQALRPVRGFAGDIDDVHAWSGVRSADQVKEEALAPVTGRPTVYGYEVVRYYNTAGYHLVTTQAVAAGSHFVSGLGFTAPDEAEGIHPVYSCRNRNPDSALDYFLHTDPTCGGHTVLGTIGRFYTQPPEGVETIAVYRCLVPGQAHYASTSPTCEDADHVPEFPLGYTRAYSNLVRYLTTGRPWDHTSTSGRVDGNYRPERVLGVVAMRPLPGTTALMLCRNGTDLFSSIDPACEGSTVVRRSGYLWTAPVGTHSVEIFRCRASWGDLFDSTDPNCERQTRDRSLGFVVTGL